MILLSSLLRGWLRGLRTPLCFPLDGEMTSIASNEGRPPLERGHLDLKCLLHLCALISSTTLDGKTTYTC